MRGEYIMTALHLEIGYSVVVTILFLSVVFASGYLFESIGSFLKWTFLAILCGCLTFVIYYILVELLAWIFSQFGIIPESKLVFAVVILVFSILTSGPALTTK